MTEETWRKITNYENYEVSNRQKWKNLLTKKVYDVTTKKAQKDGRIMIHIKDDGKDKSLTFSRIVAEAFVPNPDNKPKIWHKDKNLLNNTPDNLMWVTTTEINNLKSNPTTYTRTPVVRMDKKTNEELQKYDSLNDASEWIVENKLGNNPYCGLVIACTKGGIRYGFKWKYYKEEKEDEEWKSHPSIQNYMFSTLGRIKDRYKIKKGWLSRDGYVQIEINKKTISVHILVAETFIPNPDNLPEIDHINGNRNDNRVCNLRWCTHKQNVEYERNVVIYKYTKDKTTLIKKYDSILTACKALGLHHSNICKVAGGERHSTGGFYWSYTLLK